ncbi:6904_t:CDS:2, partial [Cetraspora pellucida]
ATNPGSKSTISGPLVFGLQLKTVQKVRESYKKPKQIKPANQCTKITLENRARTLSAKSSLIINNQALQIYHPEDNLALKTLEFSAVDQRQISRDAYRKLATIEQLLPQECNTIYTTEQSDLFDSEIVQEAINTVKTEVQRNCRDFTIQLNQQLIIALICYIFRQPQEQSNSSFVPYDSILKGFRLYRFHPRYKQEIGKHVYKLTIYSRDYNVDCKMCVFESQSRGHCNDDECTSQHWRDLQMSDKELISDMSSYYERCTPIEQQEYHFSLEALLNKLCAEGKTNEFVSNHPFDNFEAPCIVFFNNKKQLGQGIDNEETSSAYDIGSEEILEPLYEMQQDTVEDLRHIDVDYFQDQYHISQDLFLMSTKVVIVINLKMEA